MPVLGMLAVETSLLVSARVHHVTIAVAVKTSAPTFAVAIATSHSACVHAQKKLCNHNSARLGNLQFRVVSIACSIKMGNSVSKKTFGNDLG